MLADLCSRRLGKCLHKRRPVTLGVLLVTVRLVTGLLGPAAYAQGEPPATRWGVKVGPNFASLTGSYVQLSGPGAAFYEAEIGSRTGLALGGFAIVPLRPPFFVQPEILYVQKGSRIEITGLASGTGTNRAGYLEVPILLRFAIPIDQSTRGVQVQPYVVGGPTAGLKLHAGSEANGEATVERDFGAVTRAFDFGLTAGAGVDYDVAAGTAVAEVRVALGVADVISLPNEAGRTRGIMVTLGFIF